MWAGYTRVSRVGDRAETLISPDMQAAQIRTYAAGRGLDVEMLASELDVSGGKADRPILSQALQGIEAGIYEGIVVAQIDRLSRNITDALATIRRVEQAGGQVVAVAENFDVSTPEGRMGRNVFLSMAEMQLDRYKAQFRTAKRQAVERGIWPTRVVPLGYRKAADRTLEPDPETMDVVLRAFRARASGAPWSAIGQALGLGQTSVRKIVTNRVYLGELRVGEWINPTSHPPLVDRGLFDAAQLAQPPRPPRSGTESLLTGLAVCATCEGAMTPSTKKGDRYYRCQAAVRHGGRRCVAPAIISARKLEPYVEAVCLPVMEGKRLQARERSRALERAQDTLAAAEAELAAYQNAQSVSGLGPEVFVAGMTSRVQAIENAQAAVAEARLRTGAVPHGGKVAELWPGLTVPERRHLLRGLLSAVVVGKGRGKCADRVRVFMAPIVVGDGPVELGVAGSHHVE